MVRYFALYTIYGAVMTLTAFFQRIYTQNLQITLLDAVRAAVKPLVFFKTLPYPSIQLARLGADAGIIGAALLGRA